MTTLYSWPDWLPAAGVPWGEGGSPANHLQDSGEEPGGEGLLPTGTLRKAAGEAAETAASDIKQRLPQVSIAPPSAEQNPEETKDCLFPTRRIPAQRRMGFPGTGRQEKGPEGNGGIGGTEESSGGVWGLHGGYRALPGGKGQRGALRSEG